MPFTVHSIDMDNRHTLEGDSEIYREELIGEGYGVALGPLTI